MCNLLKDQNTMAATWCCAQLDVRWTSVHVELSTSAYYLSECPPRVSGGYHSKRSFWSCQLILVLVCESRCHSTPGVCCRPPLMKDQNTMAAWQKEYFVKHEKPCLTFHSKTTPSVFAIWTSMSQENIFKLPDKRRHLHLMGEGQPIKMTCVKNPSPQNIKKQQNVWRRSSPRSW